MLVELRVKNLAIVEELTLKPGSGLNVISGETGAGKSILVGAVELLLGGKGSPDLIRTGVDTARVDGLFRFHDESFFLRRGIAQPLPDGELLLTREIARNGRSRILVNDEMATLARLRTIGEAMADLHGQHEHQALLRPDSHVEYLDRFAAGAGVARGAPAPGGGGRGDGAPSAGPGTPPEVYRRARGEYLDLVRRRAELGSRHGNVEERRAGLAHSVGEIAAAALKPGEESTLRDERERVVHAEKLAGLVGQAVEDLAGGEASIATRLGHAARLISQASGMDASLEAVARQLEEGLVAAQEAARELERYQDRLQFEPDRAEWIESRLALLGRLRKKYGATEEEILARGAALKGELDGLADEEAQLARLDAEVEGAGERALQAGRALRAWRAEAARRFERGVGLELGSLGMGRAGLDVRMTEIEADGGIPDGPRRIALTESGLDRVEFFLTANPGEEARPLARTASGGELSRVMLALKVVLRGADPLPILVFDEVDAGIGGRVATEVGERLKEISAGRQVFVITHLPMIACHADHHFRVVKMLRKGRTVTAVVPLDAREREVELARMLAGAEAGPEALEAARALLAGARKGAR